MKWNKVKTKLTATAKTTGKKLVNGDYQVASKVNKLGQAARNAQSNILNDFQNNGEPIFHTPNSAYSSPFRLGDTAEVLPALQRQKEHEHNEHRNKRRPRKVVYY